MAVVMRIEDVPEDVYRELRAQARAAGLSLAEHLRTQVVQLARTTAERTDTAAECAVESDPERCCRTALTGGRESTSAVRPPTVPMQLRHRVDHNPADGTAQSIA